MKRSAHLLSAVIILTVALGGAAQAQQQPAIQVQANTVYVGADGKFETAPDTAVIQFMIGAQADSSEDAYKLAAKAADKMRAALKANGIDPKNAELGFYSLEPIYDYKNPKRKVISYRVSSNVTVKLKDFTKAGDLLTALAAIEQTANQSLSYMLENIDAAKQKAIEDAVTRAKASAQTVANACGRKLGQLLHASVDTFDQMPMVQTMQRNTMAMKAEAADSAIAEFTPQKVTVTAHVNAVFSLN